MKKTINFKCKEQVKDQIQIWEYQGDLKWYRGNNAEAHSKMYLCHKREIENEAINWISDLFYKSFLFNLESTIIFIWM